jgi:predicted anti-sigma-YlaC factor YlaD
MVMKEHSDTLRTACKDFEEDLVLYYYGDGSENERIRVQGHLQTCSSCREFLEDLRKLLPQMAKPSELPPAFWDNYYDEMVQKLAVHEERQAWWKNWFAPMRTWMMPAFGTAVVAALAIGLVISRGHWHYPFSQTQEQIPQEILTDTNQLEFFKSMDMLETLSSLEGLDGTKVQPGNNQHT